jgi:hypothetical protein
LAVTPFVTKLQRMVNQTSAVFGRHRSGAIIPVFLNIERTPEWFSIVVQRIPTTEEFMLIESLSGVVKGATVNSMSLLGVAPSEVDSGAVKLWKHMSPRDAQLMIAASADSDHHSAGHSKKQARHTVMALQRCKSRRAINPSAADCVL